MTPRGPGRASSSAAGRLRAGHAGGDLSLPAAPSAADEYVRPMRVWRLLAATACPPEVREAASVRPVKVVLLHPLPLDGRAWDDVTGRLDHEVVAPTLYELGASIEEWARRVLTSLKGSPPLVVVGNSVGGSCAIEIARLAPKQVRHLVLIGAKAGHQPEPAHRDEATRVLLEEGVSQAWRTYWEPLIGPNATQEERSRLALLAQEQHVDDLVRGVSVFHSRPDRVSFLRSWAGAVTIVAGEHDIAPHRAEQTAKELIQGRFVLLPDVGHFAPVEAPGAIALTVGQAVLEAS